MKTSEKNIFFVTNRFPLRPRGKSVEPYSDLVKTLEICLPAKGNPYILGYATTQPENALVVLEAEVIKNDVAVMTNGLDRKICKTIADRFKREGKPTICLNLDHANIRDVPNKPPWADRIAYRETSPHGRTWCDSLRIELDDIFS